MELKTRRFTCYASFFSSTPPAGSLNCRLTKPQYAVMRSIAEHPGIEQVTLTEAAVSTKATLAEMLSRMESRGLVRREHDPADKRRRFVYLTAEGEALLASSMPLGNAVDEEFLGRLNDEERQQFSQIIHKLVAREPN